MLRASMDATGGQFEHSPLSSSFSWRHIFPEKPSRLLYAKIFMLLLISRVGSNKCTCNQ